MLQLLFHALRVVCLEWVQQLLVHGPPDARAKEGNLGMAHFVDFSHQFLQIDAQRHQDGHRQGPRG